MTSKIMLKVAGPMVVLSLLLLAVGVLAAINVQKQQRAHAELIASEVNSMMAGEDIFIVLRDVRRELDLFLRTHDRRHLGNVRSLTRDTQVPLDTARRLAHNDRQAEMIATLTDGLQQFEKRFQELSDREVDAEVDRAFAELNDDFVSNKLLQPARECIAYNRQTIDRTTASDETTAQQMRIGFLLLGITGSVAGLLFGLGLARALSRSIVQLDVSVRSVAGKLNEVSGPVFISHLGDLEGLEFSFRRLEDEIGGIVERLQRHEVDLLRRQQLATVGQLAAGLAHELRNPLMPIKMLVQSAIDRGDEGCLRGRPLQVIADEITRLERSIQQFLDYARPPALQMTDARIAEVIQGTFDLVQARADQVGVRLRFTDTHVPVVARVDKDQLRQLLLNALLNSLDALSGSNEGSIHLQLLPHGEGPSPADAVAVPSPKVDSEHDAMRLVSPVDDHDQFYTIRITDNGPGFASDILERRFEPFLSTKETGTGMGLSICQRIVIAHQGAIRIGNGRQGGAEIVIVLPYGKSQPLLAAPALKHIA